MKRVNFHLTERQLVRLRAMSERTGLTVAALIRKAVDAMLADESKTKGKDDECSQTGS